MPPVDDNEAYSTLVATTGNDVSANLAASQAQVVQLRAIVEDLQGQLATALKDTAAAEGSLAESSAKNKALLSAVSKLKTKLCAEQEEVEKLNVLKTTWWSNGREDGIRTAITEAADSAAKARKQLEQTEALNKQLIATANAAEVAKRKGLEAAEATRNQVGHALHGAAEQIKKKGKELERADAERKAAEARAEDLALKADQLRQRVSDLEGAEDTLESAKDHERRARAAEMRTLRKITEARGVGSAATAAPTAATTTRLAALEAVVSPIEGEGMRGWSPPQPPTGATALAAIVATVIAAAAAGCDGTSIASTILALIPSSFFEVAGKALRSCVGSLSVKLNANPGRPWERVVAEYTPPPLLSVLTHATMTRVEARGEASLLTLQSLLFKRITILSVMCVAVDPSCTSLLAQGMHALTLGPISALRQVMSAAGVSAPGDAAAKRGALLLEGGEHIYRLLITLAVVLNLPLIVLFDNVDWQKLHLVYFLVAFLAAPVEPAPQPRELGDLRVSDLMDPTLEEEAARQRRADAAYYAAKRDLDNDGLVGEAQRLASDMEERQAKLAVAEEERRAAKPLGRKHLPAAPTGGTAPTDGNAPAPPLSKWRTLGVRAVGGEAARLKVPMEQCELVAMTVSGDRSDGGRWPMLSVEEGENVQVFYMGDSPPENAAFIEQRGVKGATWKSALTGTHGVGF